MCKEVTCCDLWPHLCLTNNSMFHLWEGNRGYNFIIMQSRKNRTNNMATVLRHSLGRDKEWLHGTSCGLHGYPTCNRMGYEIKEDTRFGKIWLPCHDLAMIITWRVWITMIIPCHNIIVMFDHGCQLGTSNAIELDNTWSYERQLIWFLLYGFHKYFKKNHEAPEKTDIFEGINENH